MVSKYLVLYREYFTGIGFKLSAFMGFCIGTSLSAEAHRILSINIDSLEFSHDHFISHSYHCLFWPLFWLFSVNGNYFRLNDSGHFCEPGG